MSVRAQDEQDLADGFITYAQFKERVAFAKAMAPRENPSHPKFANHNCAYCGSGEKPCKQGNQSRCEYPHARND